MLFSVPRVGWAVDWLGRPVHLGGLLAGIVVALMVASEPRRRPARAEPENAAPEKEPVR